MLSWLAAAGVLLAGPPPGFELAGARQNAPATRASTATPRLAVETLPAAIRDDVAGAYRRATLEPRDARSAGALAMLLHAHQQLRSCMSRADASRSR